MINDVYVFKLTIYIIYALLAVYTNSGIRASMIKKALARFP